MIDLAGYISKEVDAFCAKHGGKESVVELADNDWLFPDGCRLYIDGLTHSANGWPQFDVPADPIARQNRVVQHRKTMFEHHYALVQRRFLEYRSCYKRERVIGPNREPVTFFFDSAAPPPIEEYIAETERLFALAADWKRQLEQEETKLERMLNPPKSHEEERAEALRQRLEFERQEALDKRMQKLRL